jgi:hypothetical protein
MSNRKEQLEAIKVIESGERLYITPYIQNLDAKKNKLCFYYCREFSPYGRDDFDVEIVTYLAVTSYALSKTSFGNVVLKCLGHKKGYRFIEFVNRIKRYRFPLIKEWTKTAIKSLLHYRSFSSLKYIYIVPYIAQKEGNILLGINNQLSVEDPNGFVREYYLTPTTKYIRMRLDERVDEIIKTGVDPSKYIYDFMYQDALQYVAMRDNLAEDEELLFIVELDT